MKKAQLVILFLTLLIAQLKAQTEPIQTYNDRVNLKNGSVMFGKILHYVPEDSLILEIQNGQKIRFSGKSIEKITMAKPPKTRHVAVEKPYNFREKGLYATVNYANTFGKSDQTPRLGVGAMATAGWKFNRLLSVGAGVSFDQMYVADGEANILAAFGEVRSYLSARNRAEFFTFAAGYGHPLKNKDDTFAERNGGFMIQPTFGWRFGASERYNFFFDFGARFQRVGYLTINRWVENKYTVTYNRWILRAGFVF